MSKVAMAIAFVVGSASLAHAEPILPPGREELIGQLLGGSDVLPGGCTLDEAAIARTRVDATYRCARGTAALELRHASAAVAAAARTDQFAIVAGDGADAALIQAVAARLRAHERDDIWSSAGSAPAAAPPPVANDELGAEARAAFDEARAQYERGDAAQALARFTTLARTSPTEGARAMVIAAAIASAPAPSDVARAAAAADGASADGVAQLVAAAVAYAWGAQSAATRAEKRRAYAAALPYLERASGRWPGDAAPATLRALCLARLDRRADALNVVAALVAARPGDAAARLARAEIEAAGDVPAARADLAALARDAATPALRARAIDLSLRLAAARGSVDADELFDPLPSHADDARTLRRVRIGVIAAAAWLWLLLLLARRRGGAAPRLSKWCLLAGGAALFAVSRSVPLGVAACALLLVARDRRLADRPAFAVDIKLTHALPAVLQLIIFSYWSIYCAPAREQLTRAIPAQLAFAYAFDLLVGWALYRRATLTLGPVPVVLSANLFIWFPESHAYLGDVVIGVALASKALLTTANGRHLFNPSGLGTSLVGLLCIAWPAQFPYVDIAQSLDLPPNMLEVMFLAALVPQLKLRTAPVTLTACVAMVITSRLVGDPRLPVPLWPGWFLTITLFAGDPATMPRSASGRGVFGALIGVGVELIAKLLLALTGLDYFAKVFPVVLANLCVPALDRMFPVAAAAARRDLGWVNRAALAVWIALFAVGIGPSKRGGFDGNFQARFGERQLRRAADGQVRCDDNPVYCRPFTFAGERTLGRRAN